MATTRKGDKTILLIVDMQTGVIDGMHDQEGVVSRTALVVERARAQGAPVIWVHHENEGMPEGSPQWQLAAGLDAAAGERIIRKSYNSSFEETDLEDQLKKIGATHIVLAGASTNWCVRATAYAALERGFDLTLLSDAHGTEILDPEDGGPQIPAEDIVRELNTIMSWLRYPGRRCGTARAAEIDFG